MKSVEGPTIRPDARMELANCSLRGDASGRKILKVSVEWNINEVMLI